MPYLKNLQSLTLTVNIPLTNTSLVLLPAEISRKLTDEESLDKEVQRAVHKRAATLLDDDYFETVTANVCSNLVYKGTVQDTADFPTDPVKGWIVVAESTCITPDGDILAQDRVSMHNGSKWVVYCGTD